MTKEVYEMKRRAAAAGYIERAKDDLHSASGRNAALNATRRIATTQKRIKEWEKDFWTEENKQYYEIIYKNMPNDAEVSAV